MASRIVRSIHMITNSCRNNCELLQAKARSNDILVIWDNSGSIGFKYYEYVLDFLIALIKKLNEDSNDTHFGFLTFSSEEKTRKLIDVGDISDKDLLIKKLKKYDYDLQLYGDQTKTGLAFKKADEVSGHFLFNTPYLT